VECVDVVDLVDFLCRGAILCLFDVFMVVVLLEVLVEWGEVLLFTL